MFLQPKMKFLKLTLVKVVTLAFSAIILFGLALLAPEKPGLAAAEGGAAASNITTIDSGLTSSRYKLALTSDGLPVISYVKEEKLKIAFCNDTACSNPSIKTLFSDPDIGSVAFVSSLSLDSKGFPVISFTITHQSFDRHLVIAFCNDKTCTSVTHKGFITFGGGPLALNKSDIPTVVYTNDNNFQLHGFVCTSALCATSNPITIDDRVEPKVGTSIALNSSGLPVVSYVNYNTSESNMDLFLAVCNNASCVDKTLTPVDTNGFFDGDVSLVLDSSGYPIISYFDSLNKDLKMAVCTDEACTVKTIVTVDSVGDVGRSSSLKLNSAGLPVISYYDETNGDLKVAVCNDLGCKNPLLTSVDVKGDVGANTSLALLDDDVPVISYRSASDLKMAICNVCVVPHRTTVDSDGYVGYHTSIALNSQGNPVISYANVSDQSLEIGVCDDPACEQSETYRLWSGVDVEYSSLALTSEGNPVISYYEDNQDDLHLALCTDPICSDPLLKVVANTGLVGKYSSLALNASGNAVISYYDESDFDLKLAVCNNSTCSSPGIHTVDGATSLTGGHTSLELNSSGFPVISYHSFDPKKLILAICGDAICSPGSRTLQTIDDSGNVGWDTSLELNSSGNAVISYYDATEDDLKLAVCNNATCTQPTIRVIDSVGDVGRFSSLALTAEDYPIISYRDQTNQNLKVAVCNDITCTNPTLVTVETKGSTGDYSSLALHSSGFPIISYFDGSTNLDLKVAFLGTLAEVYEIFLPSVLQ